MKSPTLFRYFVVVFLFCSFFTLHATAHDSGRSDSLATKKKSDTKSNFAVIPAVVKSASISPELIELVDQITHHDLPFYFSGYVDVYFLKNLNNPQNGLNTGLSGAARAFDQREDQFQLGMAQTKFGWNKKKVDALIDLGFGPHADLGNYGNKIGPLGQNVATSAICLKQAFITYKLNQHNSITVGQFGTHIGYEVIESHLNYNYSLSNLFNNGPFYHQGLKLTHTFGPKLSVMAGVVNNWDNLYDNNSFKSAIAQIVFTPNKKILISLNYIGGNEQTYQDTLQHTVYHVHNKTESFKQLFDLVGNFQLTENFYIGINAAYGILNQKSGIDTHIKSPLNWGGASVYMNYSFSSKIGFGIRAELFDNSDGVQYIGKTDVQSYTGTFNIKLDQELFFKPEVRIDIYKKNHQDGQAYNEQFMDSKGNYTKNSQTTIGASLIYKF